MNFRRSQDPQYQADLQAKQRNQEQYQPHYNQGYNAGPPQIGMPQYPQYPQQRQYEPEPEQPKSNNKGFLIAILAILSFAIGFGLAQVAMRFKAKGQSVLDNVLKKAKPKKAAPVQAREPLNGTAIIPLQVEQPGNTQVDDILAQHNDFRDKSLEDISKEEEPPPPPELGTFSNDGTPNPDETEPPGSDDDEDDEEIIED